MTIHIGTSGWHYDHWDGTFYPKELPRRRWIEYYAARFHTVESNAAFYRLPKTETFASWAHNSPDDFVMAVKMSRYLTHIKRLAEPAEPVTRFMERVEGLGAKLGPVLLQLPPTFQVDLDRLDDVLKRLPASLRVAVEFRHPSWWRDEVRDCLERHEAALCLADRGSRPISPLWRTTQWTYVRFHGGTGNPWSCYGRTALESWADRIEEGWPEGDVWAYFNNDMNCCALRDARWFAQACARRDLDPTRLPPARDVSLGSVPGRSS